MDIYQQFIATRTYCRWLEKENRRESFQEAIDRYTDYFSQRIPEECVEEFHSATKYISSLDVMPSMRCLWTAGPALDREAIAGYNCAFLTVDNYRAFAEILYILMNGTGVGFSVERQFVNKLPSLPEKFKKCDKHNIVFSDSKRGWAEGFLSLLKSLYQGFIPEEIDYSRIRPEGARLKTFGGRASGPRPLKQLCEFTTNLLTNANERKLSSLECYDLACFVANCVVVGGVRRSATISLSNLSDDKMRHAKDGQFWNLHPYRALSNNSVAYTEKPSSTIFLEEWNSLIKGGSGERGIINREAFKNKVESIGREYRDDMGVNPCQPDWASVLTPNGISTIGEVSIGDKIWSEDGWVVIENKWFTGTKDVYKYKTTAGVFYGTKEHKIVSKGNKIEIGLADNIDTLQGHVKNTTHIPSAVMDGLVLGDGSVHKASNNLVHLYIGKDDSSYFDSEIAEFIIKHRPGLKYNAYEVMTSLSNEDVCMTYDRVIPDKYYKADLNTAASFLRGLYSANGSVVRERVTLKAASKMVIEQTQEMLSALGIRSYIITNKQKDVRFPNGSYDLNVSTHTKRFAELIGFIQPYKTEKLNNIARNTKGKATYDIIDVEYISTEGVYDINVSGDRHTYWSGGLNVSNCGEIILRPNEFCNLSEVVIKEHDTVDSLKPKVNAAVIFGMLQSTLTKFNFIRKEWVDNTEEERLLGVSLTGVCDNTSLKSEDYKTLRNYAHEVAAEWADKLAINIPKAITCVKPSGTVSQLVNSASGLHPRFAEYYIRRVRVNAKDPLASYLGDKGVPWSPEVSQTEEDHTTKVFSFPIKSPENCIVKDDMNAIDQLNHWRMLADSWTDHNPSATIYVADDEWVEVGAWVYRNWDKIGGLSFLPRDGNNYPLMPYEEVTEEEYNKLKKAFPDDVDFINELRLWEKEDATEGSREFACTGDKCEL